MMNLSVVGRQNPGPGFSAVPDFVFGGTCLKNVRIIRPRFLNRPSPASKSAISLSRFCSGSCLKQLQPVCVSSSSGQEGIVGGRRRLMVQFKCNICKEMTKKLVNGLAYEKGTVFVQCAGCGRHHKLVDNLGLVQEYDYQKEA